MKVCMKEDKPTEVMGHHKSLGDAKPDDNCSLHWTNKMSRFFTTFSAGNDTVNETVVKTVFHKHTNKLTNFQIRKISKLCSILWRAFFAPAASEGEVTKRDFLAHMRRLVFDKAQRRTYMTAIRSVAEYLYFICDYDHDDVISYTELNVLLTSLSVEESCIKETYRLLSTDHPEIPAERRPGAETEHSDQPEVKGISRRRFQQAVFRFFSSTDEDFSSLLFGTH